MAREEQIIIEVEVNAGESAQKLAEVRARIDAVKKAQKDMTATRKELNDAVRTGLPLTESQQKQLVNINSAIATNQAELKQLTATEKMYTAQVQIATQNDRKYGDSIVELSAQLAQLKQQYRSLSAEDREGVAGQKLLKDIQELDEKVKQADYSLGDFGRNVGNYSSALAGFGGNATKVASLFQNGFANGISAAKNSLAAFGKTMLATPFGVVLLAVRGLTAAFGSLRDAIKRSDEASTEMAKNMAQVESLKSRWRDGWNQIATTTVTSISKIIDWLDDLDRRMASSWFGRKSKDDAEAMAKATQKVRKEWEWLITAEDKLEDARREYSLRSEDRQRKIAELRDKAYNTERYTYEQRKGFYEEMIEIEKKDLEERREIANETVSLVIKRNKLMGDSSDDAKNRETQARLELKRIDTDYYNFQAGITRRIASLNTKIASSYSETSGSVEDSVDSEAEAVADARKREEDELRKLQDLQRKLITDDVQRQKMDITSTYGRQIQDIQERLRTETDLTVNEREYLAGQIKALEETMWKELAQIDEEQLKKNNENIAKMEEEAAKRLDEQVKSRHRERLLDMENYYSAQLNSVFGNPAKIAQLQLEEAERYNEYLINLDKATKDALYKSDAEYTAAILDSQAKIMEARKRADDALQSQIREVSSAMSTMTGALSDLFESAAGDSEEYEKFKKAMAIVDAMISMATTIAAATAVSTEGDPYTMAIRIATNVAAVTAQFAAVIKAIKAATVPGKPTFSTGGIVQGTSWSGDRVDARLNSGEMVINRKDQQRLWELVSGGVPFAGIDYRLLAAAVAEGVEALPAPILDYSEFTRFRRRVEQVEKIAKLTM